MAKVYERIADELRAEIRGQVYEPGSRLPTEAALTERFAVSPPTVRQALGLLEAEGIIERRHGRGTFVRIPRTKVRRTNETVHGEKERARLPVERRTGVGATEEQTGSSTSDLDFFAEYKTESADEYLAGEFGIPVGTKLLHRMYRTMIRSEGVPLSLADSYLIYDMVAANLDLLDADNEPWPGGTLNQLYTIGIEIDQHIEEVSARPPLVEEAEKLGLPPGTSVLTVVKRLVDTTGRTVEVSHVTLPGDRTVAVYKTQLARWED